MPHLEIVELVLVHCNLVNNDYLQDSKILYTFVPKKPFCSLLEISSTNHIFLKTFDSEFQEIKVWFTDQTSKPLGVEDKIKFFLRKASANHTTDIKLSKTQLSKMIQSGGFLGKLLGPLLRT